jgi:predicted metal-dependent hydrolase
MAGDLAQRTTVQVRRSTRRRRTVAAYRDGDTVVVLIPARFSVAEEREWVQKMIARLDSRESRSRRGRSDAELEARARQLASAYLDDTIRPVSVRWVSNQRGRWGSCTPADGTIRLSDRLRSMPGWVIDYVLIHELAHLRAPGHGSEFWDLVDRYPRAQRARGYLEGVAAAAGISFSDDGDLTDGDLPDRGLTDAHPTARDLAGRDVAARDVAARDRAERGVAERGVAERDLAERDLADDELEGRAG